MLLAIPWPGFTEVHDHIFRALAQAVFSSDYGQRELTFETPDETPGHPRQLRVAIVNRALMHPDGSGPVRNLDASFNFQPAALLIALIFATPVSWKRRGWALLFGLPGLYCVLLFCLGILIWSESAEIGLVTLTPLWHGVTDWTRDLIAAQIQLALPVIIWILVMFRREDRIGNLGRFIFGQGSVS